MSDYTHQVAQALAEAGDSVHVYAPRVQEDASPHTKAAVHRLPDHFGPRALTKLRRELRRHPKPRRLLVQYVPQAFGYGGMNVPFCLLLSSLSQYPVWTMFHEVTVGRSSGQRLRRRAVGAVTDLMATLVSQASERRYVSTSAWASLIEALGGGSGSVWLPVPSNVPAVFDDRLVRETRRSLLGAEGGTVVGHFGTYDGPRRELLAAVLPVLLGREHKRVGLLLGRGSEAFLGELVSRDADAGARIRATGLLEPAALAASLKACDVLVQPYPDGVSSRRSSIMAGLALGVPTVTTAGVLTEPLWRDSEAVLLFPAGDVAEFVRATGELLREPGRRALLGDRGKALYEERFALRHTIAALRMARGIRD